MNIKKLLEVLAGAVGAGIVAIVIFLMTADPNLYRGEITDALAKQTGRIVKLGGPISFGLSWRGVTLDVRDSAISNPFWASQPVMAGVGRVELGVSLLPLLWRQIVVTRLEIVNADIELETDRDGRRNWDMTAGEPPKTEIGNDEIPSIGLLSVHITRLGVSDSLLRVRNQDGDISAFKVKSLSMGVQGAGGALHFSGEYNGTPISLNLNTGAPDLLAPAGNWPFEASLAYANYKITAKGKADMEKRQASISAYDITAGHSAIHGKMAVDWSGATTSVRGNLLSDHISPADFKPEAVARKPSSDEDDEDDQVVDSTRVFSNAPLNLDLLKSVDGNLDVKIDELALGGSALRKMTGRLEMDGGGGISLAPLKALLGNGTVTGQIKIKVDTVPPKMAAIFDAPDVRLEDMLKLIGAPGFLSGKSSAGISLASNGGSMHDLAANTVGVITVVSSGGKVAPQMTNGFTGLMNLFAPGSSNKLNCLAIRFAIKDGVARDNGILVDTGVTTVAGEGGFDLGRETVGLTLHAKSKYVNVATLMPPLRVNGTFTDPSFSIDPSQTMQNVAGIFSNGGLATSDVPDVMTHEGDNACVYTLDHAQPSTQDVLSPTLTGKLGAGLNAIKDIMGNE